jgi:phosphoribosyl-ATP pyrophosphohydrolase
MSNTDFQLNDLFEIIESRKGGNIETSYTAKLFSRGRDKIAQKLGEETAEVIIEAVQGKRKKTIYESADLLYHLLVLWADMEIKPKEVLAELATRKGMSGVEEKQKRKKP